MWFATEDGLNRFDGYEFTVYRPNPNEAGSLSATTVYALLRDSKDRLWVGTFGGGLDRYQPKSDDFTTLRHDPNDETSLSHDAVFSLFEDSSGFIWVGTLGGGLNRLDPDSGSFRRFRHDPADPASLSGDRVTAIFEDSAGELWIGTDGDGLNRLDRATGGFERFESSDGPTSLSHGRVFAIHEDRERRLWIGTHGGGLNRLDRATGEFEQFRHDPSDPHSLSSNQILSIWEDRGGRLWIGTGVIWTGDFGGGLNRFDPETGSFSSNRRDQSDPNSLASDDVVSLFEDASGLLWIGTNGGGLSRFHPDRKGFTHFRRRPNDAQSLSDDAIYALFEDSGGIIWIGTWNGGLNRLDPRTGHYRHYRHDPADSRSLPHDTVNAFFEDSRGQSWVGTDGGLARFDPTSGDFALVSWPSAPGNGSGGNEAQYITEDQNGILWIGTYSGGATSLNPETGALVSYPHVPSDPDSLSSNNVYAILEDSYGDLWIGTESGLDRLDRPSQTFEHFRHVRGQPDSLGSSDIVSLFESTAGELWVGTYGGGLNKFNRQSGTFTRYTKEDGLPNDSIYGILEDGEGRLWLSTNHGISRFDPGSGTFKNFDVHDGLQSNEFDAWAFHQNSRGEMLFGGINGFNWFDPDQITLNAHPPPIVLTAFKVFNQAALSHGPAVEIRRLEIPYDDRVISFEFSALDFSVPERNQYAYKLQGFDKDWIEAGNNRDVTYTNLDPGQYMLQVKGSNNDGFWNEQALEIPLVIVPPFWMTFWFRGAMALGLILSTLAVYGIRTRSIRLRNERLAEVNEQLNEEVRKRESVQRDLELNNRELESKNEELERFSYSVSHDLKSPLVTILSFAELLEKDTAAGDPDRVASDLDRIRSAAKRMQQLLEELLQLTRVGNVVDPSEEVPLSQLVPEVLEHVTGTITEGGVEVEVQPNLASVFAPRSRVFDVLQNLVQNAVKFMGSQKTPRIWITAELLDTEVLCTVRDNGIGIEPRYQEKVFGLFERLDTTQEGTGIGLALVKRIVEGHGGRIWVESEGKDQGSAFRFTLPLSG